MFLRLGSVDALPQLYRQHQPKMSGISFPESRLPGKAPKNSLNWTIGDQGLENINTLTGKLSEAMQPSRLCKQAMFARFCTLWSKINPKKKPPVTYHDAKHAAKDYQLAKTLMVKALEANGLGTWLKKPVEQDWFDIIGAP
jgi:double stranded RNA-specific editase B